jgi:hypothetical protein
MPENPLPPGSNVRSKTYYVASTLVPCHHCGVPTRLLALALPRDHETLDPDESGEWHPAQVNAFLFYVEYLPDDIQSQLRRLSPQYHVSKKSTEAPGFYWANHCDHCGAQFDDEELHCEMDGAFMPSSSAAAANIQLLEILRPFEGLAHGYALEPEYFHLIRKS